MVDDRFWELLSKKIFDEASAAELKEIDELLFQHPDWKRTAETLTILSQLTPPTETNIETERAFETHLEKIRKADIWFKDSNPDENANDPAIHQKRSPLSKFRKWGIPVGVASILVMVFFIFRNNAVSPSKRSSDFSPLSQVTTKPGSKTQLQLPDGSLVWLNANSNLTYNKEFDKNFREVNLTGEAFFEVVKDPSHPFIIHTKMIDIKVLGTRFNVKAYPDDAYTETSLIRGSVEVTVKNRPNEKHYLKPNEKISVANDLIAEPASIAAHPKALVLTEPLTYSHIDSTVVETSWVDNKLVFQENETFMEVALKMERWYGVHISFADEEVAQIRLYGSFTTETITQALDALREGFRFNYKITGNNILISKN